MSDAWDPAVWGRPVTGPDPTGVVDVTRPLILGYLRADLCATQDELARTRKRMADVAHREGYTLGSVFTEHPNTAPAALDALIQAVRYYGARAVIAPCPRHLTVLGAKTTLTEYVKRATGVRLFLAEDLAHCPVTTASHGSQAPRSPP